MFKVLFRATLGVVEVARMGASLTGAVAGSVLDEAAPHVPRTVAAIRATQLFAGAPIRLAGRATGRVAGIAASTVARTAFPILDKLARSSSK